MQSTVLSKGMLLKWVLPIVLVVALLGFWGASALGGGSGGGLGDLEITDVNPGYSSEVVVPSESATGPGGVFVLYSIDVAEPTSLMPLDSTTAGGMLTITVTNNIGEAIANDGIVGDPNAKVCNNGDIMGNVLIDALVYHRTMGATGILSYPKTPVSAGVAEFDNIIIHPGKSVVLQLPESVVSAFVIPEGTYDDFPGGEAAAVALGYPAEGSTVTTGMDQGDIILYKAEYVGASACFEVPAMIDP
jgi:hypothetical protein